MKGFILPRKLNPEFREKLRSTCPEMAEYCIANLQGALPAISLVNEVGLTTAYANAVSYTHLDVYKRQE